MRNKKGEMTTQQIIVLIVLIASFAVLLFFLFRLNLGEETESEICHNSVIMKEKSLLAETVPLKCQRQYVCISEDGSCEKMTSPRVEKVESKEEVYQVLADELANCWWMFGEGKINYIGTDTFPEMYCSLCSQIAFDDSVKEIFDNKDEFDKKDFYDYLSSNKSGKDQTYTEYLQIKNLIDSYSGDYENINLDSQYYSLMGIRSDTGIIDWVGVGTTTGIILGSIALIPFSAGTSLLIGGSVAAGVGTGGYFLAPVIEGNSGEEFIPPSLIETNSQEFRDLNCEDIVTLS